ncbi:hypothetical protein SEVIR_5G342600v4 [Setaria viridis]|uniref:Uncharacterized protein n=1 Tax=Setaria viridis TaxID=4556 RepID=A0A4U6V0D5_SETVI|nr:hypothetical protein SEVIR_5G342600v2 [Setaria viridis]
MIRRGLCLLLYCLYDVPDNLPRTLLMYFSNTLDAAEFYFQKVMANLQRFRNSTVNHSVRFDVPPPPQLRYEEAAGGGGGAAGACRGAEAVGRAPSGSEEEGSRETGRRGSQGPRRSRDGSEPPPVPGMVGGEPEGGGGGWLDLGVEDA